MFACGILASLRHGWEQHLALLLEERGIVVVQEIEDEATTSPQKYLERIAKQESTASSAMLPTKRATRTVTAFLVSQRHFIPRRL